MLGDFFSQGLAQLNLFDENAPYAGSEKLIEVLDHLFTVSEALFGSGMRLSNTPEEYSLMYGQSEHSKECGAKQV